MKTREIELKEKVYRKKQISIWGEQEDKKSENTLGKNEFFFLQPQAMRRS
jgi:hypothetical protein